MSAPTESISDQKARRGFWVVASLGAVAAAIAWTWYGGAQFEAQSEQPKALSAGTTMAGFAELFGGVPLVIAHLLGLVLLLLFGWWGYGKRGIAMALVAFVGTSLIGIIVAQILFAGELFELGINNDPEFVP
jgi:hypothetical protein